MTAPTFWDYLSRSTDELVALGMPRRDVVARRFAATGHVRPLDIKWVGSCFMWGHTHSLDEIADRVGTSRADVKGYAKAKGLRYATRTCRRSHAELAVMLWADRGRSPDESCATFGVYPVERRVLCAAGQVLVDRVEGGIATVLGWNMKHLDSKFAEIGVVLRPPAHLLRPETRTAGERDEVVRVHLAGSEAA